MKLIEQLCADTIDQINIDKNKFNDEVKKINDMIISYNVKGNTKLIIHIIRSKSDSTTYHIDNKQSIDHFTYYINTTQSIDIIINMLKEYYIKEGFNVHCDGFCVIISWADAIRNTIKNLKEELK